MTTTREAFEAWAINYGYRMDLIKDTQVFDCDQTAAALNAWKAATKKATAAEREACAQVCTKRNLGDGSREDQEAINCANDIKRRGDA